MKAKHTPGPWKVETPMIVVAENDDRFLRPRIIAVCHGDCFDYRSKCEANTRLIAASPTLLKALRGMISYAKNDNTGTKSLAVKAARDAIRLALPEGGGH